MKASSIRACFSLFRLRTTEALQYRMAAFAGASIGIFWALMEITVYTVFYTYADNRGGDFALSLPQMVCYVWLGQMLWGLQQMSIDREIHNKITSGDVGIELCRPLDLYFHWFAKSAAGKLGGSWWRAFITMIAGLLMPLSYRLLAPDSLAGFVMFLCALASAFVLCSSFGMLVNTIRLGTTWGEGPTYMLMLVSGVLSGAFLPLQLWPDFLQKILFFQPFAGAMDIPARLYVGSMPPGEAFWAIGMQLFWSAVFIVAGRLLMRRKLKNIIVQGG